jgi:predicted NBD/HSP70 family sugar kinase
MSARMNSAAIRRINIIRLFHALRENPNRSQAELGRLTGLDKATTSAVVAQLLKEGLVARTETGGTGRARRVGRPETALSIPPSAGLLVGARLEPAMIRIVAALLDGTVVEHHQIPGSTDIGVAIERLSDGVARVLCAGGAGLPLRAVGVGVPALMDRAGRLVLAPALGWRDIPIGAMLQQAFPVPVHVDNDTKAAAVAEKLFGTCREVEDFIYLTGHSGVGGGLFLGRRLYRGAHGFAGEIGHVTVEPDGRPCGCGKRGCLETYVSEAALLARAQALGRPLADIWAAAEAARAGDAAILDLLEEAGERLGLAVSNVANLLDPELVVLSGSLAVVSDFILPALQRSLDRYVLAPLRSTLRLTVSPFGIDAVPMGGIALALEGFLASPDTVGEALQA